MTSQPARSPGLLILERKVFTDSRGFFSETFHQKRYHDIGLSVDFVQEFVVLRPRHSSRAPSSKPKFPREAGSGAKAEVFDVAVDIRRNSPTFGRWHGLVLSVDTKRQFYISHGFAHGFAVISDAALFPPQMHANSTRLKTNSLFVGTILILALSGRLKLRSFPRKTGRGYVCARSLLNGYFLQGVPNLPL
jgi:dTDP-4-dehydrorhamnose 3,5-epimerase